jgi:phasin family protein
MADADVKKGGFMVFSLANNGLPLSGPEVETIFASQRKNVEAIMQANRLAFDGVQAVWLRQLGFIQEAVEGLTTHVGDLAPPYSPLNDKIAKQAEYSKQVFEKNLSNACEITEIATKVTTDATNIINQRFRESLDEVPYLRKKAER